MSRATVIGLLLSVVLHACLLLIAAAISTGGGGGGRGTITPPVEVAILDETALTSLNDGSASLDTPGVDEVKGSIDLAPMPVIETPGGSGLSDSGDLGNVGTGMGGAGSGEGIGIGPGSGGAGAGGTSFFGVESRGNRFAFVVDISGSMDGEKLDYLKRELVKAIDRLTENSSYVVLCFESDVRPLGGVSRLTPASSKHKKTAIDAIGLLRAEGGTQPANAFRLALRARPRPDAIYFMTDGLFSDDVVDEIRADLRNGRNVPIHCIAFMDKSSEPLMRKIAEMSDGSYTFVEAPPALMHRSITIALSMCLAAAAGGDVVEIRGQDAVLTGEIAALSPAGVSLKVGEGVSIRVISWDRVRAIKAEKLPAPGAVIFAPLSERLLRARLRMERLDLSKAEEIIDPLYAEHSTAGTLAGPTGALLAECALRIRLYHGGGTNAVTPWLDWLACRAGMGDDKQKQEWFGGATALPAITDRASGLCPDVPPIFGGHTAPAAIRALIQRADWVRLLSSQSPVRGMASAYAAAVLFEAGEPFVLPPLDSATSDGERLVLEIVTARAGGDSDRESARGRLRKRLEQLERVDDSRESTDPASTPDDRTWQRPWLHAALGRSLLRETDAGQRRLGLVEVLHVPALYARTQPRLAASCLFDALAELRLRGERPEAISAIERELRSKFQIDIDSPEETVEVAPVKNDESLGGGGGGGGGMNP